jgi:hypothetical protein
MKYLNSIYVGDVMLEILREFNPSYFFTEKNSNAVNQKLLGIWVDHLGGDRVVHSNNKFLICRTIEEAQIIEE